MIRFLLWTFVVYIVYKLVEAFLTPDRRRPGTRSQAPCAKNAPADFSNIEDADFEDLTPKKPPETKEP